MTTKTTEHAASLEDRFHGKYLSITSYKRDGDGVATPVWFVVDGGRLLVITDLNSWKVRRIRNNPEVSIARCTASGRLRGEPERARAEILAATELDRVKAMVDRKYRFDELLTLPIYRAVMRLRHGRRPKEEPAVLAITPGG
jgi:PPOX class probable F420-dependent enzyme